MLADLPYISILEQFTFLQLMPNIKIYEREKTTTTPFEPVIVTDLQPSDIGLHLVVVPAGVSVELLVEPVYSPQHHVEHDIIALLILQMHPWQTQNTHP